MYNIGRDRDILYLNAHVNHITWNMHYLSLCFSLLCYIISYRGLIWYVRPYCAGSLQWHYGNLGSYHTILSLRWRNNGCDSVSNHQPRDFTQPFIQTQIKENIKAPCHRAFVRGIHRCPHKWPVTRKMFPFDDVIMYMHFVDPLYVVLNTKVDQGTHVANIFSIVIQIQWKCFFSSGL